MSTAVIASPRGRVGRGAPTTELPGTSRLFTRPVVALLGITLAALLVGGVIVIVDSFRGTFSSDVTLHAILPAGANAPQLNSPVEYRDVTVGQVASSGQPVGGGRVSIKLRMKPGELTAIPDSVRATVGPLSIFGNQYVDLQLEGSTSAPALRAGETIDAIPRGPGASLQSTIASFYDVLSAIHPAQLEASLTTFANGLRGQGEALGRALHGAATYFDQMIPLLPTLEDDLRLLTPAADDLSRSTPDLLGLISNLTTTGRTIAADATAVHQLFSGGSVVSGQAADLLSSISLPFEQILADSGPLLDDINQSPTEIAQTLSGLDRWSKAWTADIHGPDLSVTSTVHVDNAADLVLASLGAPDTAALFATGLGGGKVDPPTYTAANCPSYGTEHGTDCGGSNVVDAASTASSTNVLTGAEQQAAASVASGLDGGRAPASPSVSTLLLGPVLAAMEAGA